MLTEQEKRKRKVRQNYIFFLILYLLLCYFLIHTEAVFKEYDEFINHLNEFDKDIINHIKSYPFYLPKLNELRILAFSSVFYWAVATYIMLDIQKKYMFGKEHGTAKWAEKKDIQKLADKDESKNIILTKTEMLSIDTRKTRKNLICGKTESVAGKYQLCNNRPKR